jgi:SAM-dependent methyltransferase
MRTFEELVNPVLDSEFYKEEFEILRKKGLASEYHRGDLVREVAMSDILEELEELEELPEGPIFEYGPSTVVIRCGLPHHLEFIVKNWPEVDCMREDFPKESLSVIISDFTLEHIARPWKAVESTYNMLKPGGIGIFTTHWVFLDHTGAQEEDYWRFSPKGLKVLFEDFSIVAAGCWGNSRLTCEILHQYADGSEGVMRKDIPAVFDEEIMNAKDRIFATTSWIIVRK